MKQIITECTVQNSEKRVNIDEVLFIVIRANQPGTVDAVTWKTK